MSVSWRAFLAGAGVAALATLGAAPRAGAQEVEFRSGSGGLPLADGVIREVLRRDRYRVVARDTILEAGDVIDQDVIVLGASLRLAGAVRGDLIAVESDIFTRPGARAEGAVVVLNGGFYGSALADLATKPIDGSLYDYRVEQPDATRYRIVAPGGRASLRPLGLMGLLAPSYDRVNALTLAAGVRWEPGGASVLPSMEVRARGRSARERLDGEVRLDWSLGRNDIFISGGRTVRTNDAWILDDFGNSVTSLMLSADYRDYYDARFVGAGVRVAHGQTVRWDHRVTFDFEDSRSLQNQDPFSIFDYRGDFRLNRAVDEGEIGSLSLVSSLEAWPRPLSELTVTLRAEGAARDLVGDFTYARVWAALRAELSTADRHWLVLNARAQGMGGADTPRQRWVALGGERTLPVLDRLARGGDQLWWLELVYRVEAGPSLGPLGLLQGWVSYGAGNAWLRGGPRPAVTHNLGLGVNLGPVSLGAYTDPGDEFESRVIVGIAREH